MKHALKVFSGKGDTTVCEWDVEIAEEVEIAKGAFDQARADGFAAVVPTPEGARPVDTFEPNATETFLLKPIAGG